MILFVEMGEFEIIMILFIFCVKFVFILLDCIIFELFFLELFDNGFWIKLFDLGEFEIIIILLILEIWYVLVVFFLLDLEILDIIVIFIFFLEEFLFVFFFVLGGVEKKDGSVLYFSIENLSILD